MLSAVEPRQAAVSAGLRYVTDQIPGIRRVRVGKRFRYVTPHGNTLKDRNELQRISSLAIPPAWRDVWICPSPNGHLQATGRDAKGRKQHRYHSRWREVRDESKYGRILEFDPKQPNSAPDVLRMPKDVQPTDLVVHNDDIMVWDGGVRTLKAAAQQSTRGLGDEIQLEEVSSRGVDDQVAASAFAQMGSQPPGSATDLLDQNTRAAVIGQGRQPDRQ